MNDRECGNCSMCCKLPSIAVLDKPADKWCQHCKPGLNGCQIYDARPSVCSDFKCEWLREDVEDIWRPTVAKMVLHVSKAGEKFTFMNCMVDLGSPNRWREPAYHSRLRQFATLGMLHNILVRVQVGSRSWIVMPKEDIEIPEGTKGFDVFRDGALGWKLKFITGEKNVQDQNTAEENRSC